MTEMERKIEKRARRWERYTTPTGVPFYWLPGTDLRIEADQRLSSHVGWVFGQYVDEADRKPRIHGWKIFNGDKYLGEQRKLADAKATAERRLV